MKEGYECDKGNGVPFHMNKYSTGRAEKQGLFDALVKIIVRMILHVFGQAAEHVHS